MEHSNSPRPAPAESDRADRAQELEAAREEIRQLREQLLALDAELNATRVKCEQTTAMLNDELHAMERLHGLSLRSVHGDDLSLIFSEIVDAAIAITGADFGNIQILDRATATLRIVAHRGFPSWWIDFWERVSKGQGVCGSALARAERIIVEDVETSPIFEGTPALDIQRRAGVRAVQSTPLLGHRGTAVGMFSTHFRAPHRPSERQLRLLDLLARHSADIIDRHLEDEAAREREARLRFVIRNSAIVFAETDRELRYVLILNPHRDFDPSTVLGKTDVELHDSAGTRQLMALKRRVLESGVAAREVVEFERSDGTRVFDFLIEPICDGSGGVCGLTSAALDITERRRLEMESQSALEREAQREREREREREEERGRQREREHERRLQHAQRLESIGVLAGGIAHDFNNLLQVIVANACLLKDVNSTNPLALRHVESIGEAASRATSLTKQLLAYAGKGKMRVEALDISKLCGANLQMLRASISKKAMLSFELHSALPSIRGDASQLSQVIMNLILNASEALGDEPGDIRVRTHVVAMDACRARELSPSAPLPAGTYVVLEVADSGCGMDKDTLAKIYDPFFSTKFAGRGLGLSAVQGIVASHKGAIQLESEFGKGATFTVFLPASEDTALPQPESAAPTSGPALQGTILIVEDEEMLRNVLRLQLERLGFLVLEACDGEAALDVYRRNAKDIALVLLDYKMPRLDGPQTFAALKKINPTVSAFLTSGYAEMQSVEGLSALGWSDFLDKPYEIGTLERKVRKALARNVSPA